MKTVVGLDLAQRLRALALVEDLGLVHKLAHQHL